MHQICLSYNFLKYFVIKMIPDAVTINEIWKLRFFVFDGNLVSFVSNLSE